MPSHMFQEYFLNLFSPFQPLYPRFLTLFIIIFVIIEWLGREQQYAIAKLGMRWKSPFRYAMYYAIIIAIFWFAGEDQQFIYFQF
jgi:hypothetical protein